MELANKGVGIMQILCRLMRVHKEVKTYASELLNSKRKRGFAENELIFKKQKYRFLLKFTKKNVHIQFGNNEYLNETYFYSIVSQITFFV